MTISAPAFHPNQPLLDLLEDEFDLTHLASALDLPSEAVPKAMWEKALLGPAREILARPGKAFRQNLVTAAWRLCGGASPVPVALTLLVEILHTGSLVIDDIEDSSPERRGRPALHALYGVPVALNTGNWLYFLPLALLSRMGLAEQDELALQRAMNRTLLACHYGQALDLTAKLEDLAQRDVANVVLATTRLKTGGLLSLAAQLGAVAAGGEAERARALSRFGRELGVGLQMLDDLGGLTSQKRRHKGHEDLRLGRLTWPWAWTAEQADQVTFRKLRALAGEVERGREHPEVLAMALRQTLGTTGRENVRRQLMTAHSELAEAVGPSPLLSGVRQEIERMEESYVR